MITYLRPRPASRPLVTRPVYWVAHPQQSAAYQPNACQPNAYQSSAYVVQPRTWHQPTRVASPIAPQGSLPIELSDQGDAFTVRASLPGLEAKHLDIQASRGAIVIAAHLTENFAPFRRVINLPSPIQHTQVAATFRDGILSLTLPKALPDTSQAVKVEVAPRQVHQVAPPAHALEPEIQATEEVVLADPRSWESDPDLMVDPWAAA